MHSHGRAPRPSVRRRTAATGRRTGRGSARSTPARVAGRLLGVHADAAPPALQCLGLFLEFLCPFPELLSNLRSNSDPQQVAAPLGFRSHIVRAKHGGFCLSPPLGNKSHRIATPANTERLPAMYRRYPQVAATPGSGLVAPGRPTSSKALCAAERGFTRRAGRRRNLREKMILTARLLRLARNANGMAENRRCAQSAIRALR